MKVINLFGGPGSGKSTTAAGLFHLMKVAGYSVELVTEFAKDLTWDDSQNVLKDQMLVFAEQNHRLWRLEGKVDFAITDSPLLLSHIYYDLVGNCEFYNELQLGNKFLDWVDNTFLNYDNINFFIRRVKPYIEIGRNQNEEESDMLSHRIKVLLATLFRCSRHGVVNYGVDFISLDGNEMAPRKILDMIEGA